MENIPDIKSLFDVTDKVALITGASGGFGGASAKGLAKAGARVMLTGRSEDKLEAVAREIEDAGFTAAYVAGHPASEDDNVRIVAETVKRFRVNNLEVNWRVLNREYCFSINSIHRCLYFGCFTIVSNCG